MTENQPAPDANLTNWLADGARAGDVERFSELYARVAPRLHVWADLRMPAWLRASVEPDDVVQEVWARAIVKFDDFDSGRAPFGGWLIGFARHVLAEFLRRGIAQRGEGGQGRITLTNFDLLPGAATTVVRHVSRKDEGEVLARRVRELDEPDQVLLRLRGLEEQSHDDIAATLGVDVAVVRKRWQRLRARLQEMGFAADLIDS